MKNKVAEQAGITLRFLDYLLKGQRDAAPRTARRLEAATGIPGETWAFASAAERREAWKNFVGGSKAARQEEP